MANNFYAPFGLSTTQANKLDQAQTDEEDLPYIEEALKAKADYWNKMRQAGMDADVFKGTPEGASLAQKMEMARQKVLGSYRDKLPSFSADSVGNDIAKYTGREEESNLLSQDVPIGAIDSKGEQVTRTLREILADPSLQERIKTMDADARTNLVHQFMQGVNKRYANTAQSLLAKAGLTSGYNEEEDYAKDEEDDKAKQEQAIKVNQQLLDTLQGQYDYLARSGDYSEETLKKMDELSEQIEKARQAVNDSALAKAPLDYSTVISNIKSGDYSKEEKTAQAENWLNSSQGFDKLFKDKFTNTSLGNNTVSGAIGDWGSQYKSQLAGIKAETGKLGNRLAGITKLSPKIFENFANPDFDPKFDSKDNKMNKMVSTLHDSHPNLPIKFIEAVVADASSVVKAEGPDTLWVFNTNIKKELDKALDLLDTPEGRETFKIYTNEVARSRSFEAQLDNDIKALQQKYGNTSTRQLMNVDNPYMKGKRASLKQDMKRFTAKYLKYRVDQEEDLGIYKKKAKQVEELVTAVKPTPKPKKTNIDPMLYVPQ